MSGAELTPYTPEQVVARMYRKNGLRSNGGICGAASFQRRDRIVDEAMKLAAKIMTAGDVHHFPSILGARSIKLKERLIFMYSFAVNIVELAYVYAAMDYLEAHHDGFAAWLGQPNTEYSLNRERKFEKANWYLSTDFSHMDMSCGPDQSKQYLELVLPMFKPQYRERYRQVCIGKLDNPVIIGTLTRPGTADPGAARGQTKKRQMLLALAGIKGKTSGEGDTNFMETILNCLYQIEISLQPKVEVVFVEVDGDDAASGYKRAPANLPEIAESIASRYGLVANADKQMWSQTTMTYLQRQYDVDETRSPIGVLGSYPFILATNSAKNPERESYLTGDQRAVRVIEIYENSFHHPHFEDIVDFAVAGSPTLEAIREDPTLLGPLKKTWQEMISSSPSAVSSHGHQHMGLENYAFCKLLVGDRPELSYGLGPILRDSDNEEEFSWL